MVHTHKVNDVSKFQAFSTPQVTVLNHLWHAHLICLRFLSLYFHFSFEYIPKCFMLIVLCFVKLFRPMQEGQSFYGVILELKIKKWCKRAYRNNVFEVMAAERFRPDFFSPTIRLCHPEILRPYNFGQIRWSYMGVESKNCKDVVLWATSIIFYKKCHVILKTNPKSVQYGF